MRTIFDEIDKMHEHMDHLFNNFFSDSFVQPKLAYSNSNLAAYKRPASDLYETDKEIVAKLDMPGIDKKDIKINVTDYGIEIKAETKKEEKKETKGNYRYERSYSGFYRSFALPEYANAKEAKAEYKEGVLKISIPKKELPHKEVKQIEVK